MPLKSGKEYLREIRAKAEWANVQIVILTTSGSKTDFQECMLSGANHYFVKPTSFDEIKRLTRKMLQPVEARLS